MSWIAVGIIGGAVVGGISQQMTNRAQANASRNAGKVDVTTTRNGNPFADPYRQAGMQSAYDALYGTSTAPGTVQGNPYASQAAAQPDTTVDPRQAWRQQRRAAASKPGTGSGSTAPAAPAPKPFTGMSDQTDAIRTSMMGLPDQNAGMYGTAEQFMTDTLGGTERNPYRADAASAAHAISEDPGLAEYMAAIKRQLGVDGTGGGGPANRSSGSTLISYGFQPGSGGQGGYGGGSATGTDKALRELVAGGKPAGWDEMQAGISRQVEEARAQNIRDLRARAVGSGFYGGDVYQGLEEGAIAQGDQKLADSLAAARFGAYQNALQEGTQYDLGMANIASNERSAGAAAGASAAANQAALAQQRELALYGDWAGALGMGQQGRTASAGALGDLAHLTSADQQGALQGIDALGASRRGDLAAAGELSLGSDQARNAYIASQNSLKASLANTNMQRGVANAQLGWAQQQFYDPMSRLGAYGNLLNSFYGNLGSETTTGFDGRSQSPAQMGSVGGAAMSGAALGGQIGSMYNSYNAAPSTGGGYVVNMGVNPYA